jgi:hypothetical protein
VYWLFMKKLLLVASFVSLCLAADFRPPAVPLIAHDPYFSVWSFSNGLAEDATRHWTGSEQPLTSLVRIDGKTYRIMGRDPRETAALRQVSVEALPTRTIYRFDDAGIELTLTFITPALPRDLDVLSRPATYVAWSARTNDGKPHAVSVYFDAAAQLAVNTRDERVAWSRYRVGDLTVLRAGSQRQNMLARSGDDLRIDWGYLYVTAPKNTPALAAGRWVTMDAFRSSGRLPDTDDLDTNRPAAGRETPVLAFVLDLGNVGATPSAGHVTVAYDDLYSIEYLERRLRPYWRRNGDGASEMLRAAERDYERLAAAAEKFDAEKVKVADLAAAPPAGGEE